MFTWAAARAIHLEVTKILDSRIQKEVECLHSKEKNTSSHHFRLVVDREVDHWVFSRKGKLGSIHLFIWGHRASPPNISEISKKFVKIRPCCKRNGHGLVCDLL